MRIAVASKGSELDSAIDSRFARANCFIVTDSETGVTCVIDNNENRLAEGVAGFQAAIDVEETGAKAVVTGNIGPNAFVTLDSRGIKVYAGVTGTVADALAKLQESKLHLAKTPTVAAHWGLS